MATTPTTQSQFPWRAALRTAFQLLIALAGMWGVVSMTGGLPDTGFWGGLVALSAGVTRVFQLPVVNRFIERFAPWLAAAPPAN